MGNCFPKHVDSSLPSSNTRPPTPVPPLMYSLSEHIDREDDGGEATSGKSLKIFSFEELKSATNKFGRDRVLGGEFDLTYKGWIDETTYAPSKLGVGIPVAVQILTPNGAQAHKELQEEADLLGKFSHPNLVKMIGYCWQNNRLLFVVYEYMHNGSLDNHLFRTKTKPLSWDSRVRIAIDAARGLMFLHTIDKQVIHRDFQASNILLDMEYNAKLSDFGFAKDEAININISPPYVPTKGVTTYGHDAPPYIATDEYMTTDNNYASTSNIVKLNVKRDIYGFGVVLLEILTGRRLLDLNRPIGEHNLIDWAGPALPDKKKLRGIMDHRLEAQYPSKAAFKLAGLILKCIGPDPIRRPTMAQVLEDLEVLEKIRIHKN